MNDTVDLKALGVPTVTRPRGHEAAERLRNLRPTGQIALLLDEVDLLSFSFLDEVVLVLRATDDLQRVTFVTREPRTLEKLEGVVALRQGVTIYTQRHPTAARTVVAPRSLPGSPAAVFKRDKAAG